MHPNKNQLIILIPIILLLILSFAFLDIGVRSSNTNADSAVSAYSAGTPGTAVPPLPRDILLYVYTEDSFDARMEKELINAFEEAGLSMTLTDEIKEDYGSQFVFVNVIGMNSVYTPVYSKSDTYILFGFSSTGKTLYLDITGQDDKRPVVFSSEGIEGYQLLVQGDISLQDETKGVFTYLSYQKHLAAEAARSVASALGSQLDSNR